MKASNNSPEALQLRFSQPQSAEVERTTQASIQSVQVLQKLKEKKKVGTKELQFEKQLFSTGIANRGSFDTFPLNDASDRIPGCKVPEQPVCRPQELFRSMNGECNSVKELRLGRAQTSFSRFFPAEYEDGIWQPRSKALSGDPLPSARLVSERVVRTSQKYGPMALIVRHAVGPVPQPRHDLDSGVRAEGRRRSAVLQQGSHHAG